jgi:hypothetical protein
MNQPPNLSYRIGWACIVTFSVLLIGCYRPPQLGAQNRRLLESLKTAVMAKNSAWLEENATLIEIRRKEGRLSDQEYGAFTLVVREARANNWASAQDEMIRWSKAQHPSAEEQERMRAKQAVP